MRIARATNRCPVALRFLLAGIAAVVPLCAIESPVLAITPYQASNAIGQTNLDTLGGVDGFSAPAGMALDPVHHRLFAADSENNRVLVFNLSSADQLEDKQADYVIGKSSITDINSSCGITSTTLCDPQGLALGNNGSLLYVADKGNSRIVGFNVGSLSSGMAATVVVGQPDFTSNTPAIAADRLNRPEAITVDSIHHRLFVADTQNERVLAFDLSSNDTPLDQNAEAVLGQSTMTAIDSSHGTDAVIGTPLGLAVDPSGTRLFVSDGAWERVVLFDITVVSSNEAAQSQIGQDSLVSYHSPSHCGENDLADNASFCRNGPITLDVVNHRLFVSDINNYRVLVFNTDSNHVPSDGVADAVLGQTDFTSFSKQCHNTGPNTSSGPPTAASLCKPNGLTVDPTGHRLYIGDTQNNRVSIFDTSVVTNSENAIDVMGQTDGDGNVRFTFGYPNDSSPSSSKISRTTATEIDPIEHRLFAVDSRNNRILIYNMDQNDELIDNKADYVLGQPNFDTNSSGRSATQLNCQGYCGLAYDSQGKRLFVTDDVRILVFDLTSITNGEAAVHVLGQPDFASDNCVTTQNGVCYFDSDIEYDATNKRLFVVDPNAPRVLVFDVATVDDYENAIYVIGQDNFTNTDSGTSDARFEYLDYGGIVLDGDSQRLFVTDNSNNRVLVFNVAPGNISNGMTASNVLGQPNFTSNTSAVTQAGLSSPQGLTLDTKEKKLFVTEYPNRIKVFDVKSIVNGEAAMGILGQLSFTANVSTATPSSTALRTDGIAMSFSSDNRKLYVPDTSFNRVAVFDFLRIGNTTISSATRGQSYQMSLQATGGQGAKSYALSNGTLPQGLTLNSSSGVISGTPTESGNTAFTVTASDDNGVAGTFTDSREFTLAVANNGGTDSGAGKGQQLSSSSNQKQDAQSAPPQEEEGSVAQDSGTNLPASQDVPKGTDKSKSSVPSGPKDEKGWDSLWGWIGGGTVAAAIVVGVSLHIMRRRP